jgi:GT2 family glycosyltransferase
MEMVAVINSFNRRDLLERAIESLTNALRQASFASAVIVFEAGSTDGSREFLIEWRDRNPADNLVVVLPTAGRSSFSDGVNAECAAALKQFPQCKWLLLFETDNWVSDPEPLAQAISLLTAERSLAAAGFTVRHHAGGSCGYGMRFPSLTSLALGLNLSTRWGLDRPNDSAWQTTDNVRWRTCDVVFTSPLLIRSEVWGQIGGLDARRFPFSDTDLDWAWRCAALGWKMAVIATDQVVHDNLERPSGWSANRIVEFHRSRLRLLKLHRGQHAVLIKPFLFLRHCAEAMILAQKRKSDPTASDKLARRQEMLRTVWNDYV